MHSYDTVTQAVEDLVKRGYTLNFNLRPDCIEVAENNLRIHPEEFVIDEIYRFEGDTDPGDESIVLAISSVKYNVKGVIVNAFGLYAEPVSAEIVKKLNSILF